MQQIPGYKQTQSSPSNLSAEKPYKEMTFLIINYQLKNSEATNQRSQKTSFSCC
jgi:hypothetical protein